MINKKGVALILAIGILALLAIIATSFALNMQLEYRAAKNYYNSVNARYLAEAALQRAIAELRKEVKSDPFDSFEPGEQWSFTDSLSSTATSTIIDEQRKVNVNNANKLLLENLFFQLTLPGVSTANSIYLKINLRPLPNRGYKNLQELVSIADLTEEELKAIKGHVTVHSYVDPDVGPGPEPQPRSPININTAEKETLKSVLRGVIEQTKADRIAFNDGGGTPPSIYNRVRGVSADFFTSWGEFDAYIDSFVTANIISTAEATLVKNNCNPNRSKPATYTTEFCFNSGGYYTITGTGTVKDAANKTLAERALTATVKIYEIYTETTTLQFEEGTPVRVTWLDSCPVNSGSLFGSYSISNKQLILGSLKLGYWDDFNVANRTYTAAQWTTTTGYVLEFQSGYGQAGDGDAMIVKNGVRCNLYRTGTEWAWDNFSLRVFANDYNTVSGSQMKNVAWLLFRNSGPTSIIPSAYQPVLFHSRQAPLTWDGSNYAYLKSSSTGEVKFLTWEGARDSGWVGCYDQPTCEAARHNYSPGQVRIFTGYSDYDGENWDWDSTGYGIPFSYTPQKTFNLKASGSNMEAHIFTSSSSSTVLNRNVSGSTSGIIVLYGNQVDCAWDDLRIISQNGYFDSQVKTLPSSAEWGTITGTITIPLGASSESETVLFKTKSDNDGGIWKAPTGNSITSIKGTGIQYQAMFQTNDSNIRQTPVLEDVTITYLPKAKILSYSHSP